MGEFIVELLIGVLFCYPGAFIVWAVSGFKGTYKSVLNEDPMLNSTVGVGTAVAITVLVLFLVN